VSSSDHQGSGVCIAITTAPAGEAKALARRLLEARLIACANLLGPVRSLYWWQGSIESADETVLLLKTNSAALDELRSRLSEWHSYDVPEFLVFAVDSGLPAYLSWVEGEVLGGS
jgi:periplasmic divalent cation tolerance protein